MPSLASVVRCGLFNRDPDSIAHRRATLQHLRRDVDHVPPPCFTRRLPRCPGGTTLVGVKSMATSRRGLALWMLWLSLLGLVPSAFACPGAARATDNCCPSGQRSPCERQAPPSVAQFEQSCCALQPAPQLAAIYATPSRKMQALPVPFGSDIGVSARLSAVTNPFDPPTLPSPVNLRFDRPQTYLLTGRLRL